MVFDKNCFRLFNLEEDERNKVIKVSKTIEGGNPWKTTLHDSEIIYHGKCYKSLLIVSKISYQYNFRVTVALIPFLLTENR